MRSKIIKRDMSVYFCFIRGGISKETLKTFFFKIKKVKLKIILKYKRVYGPLHPCLSIILQICILTKILVGLIESHSISILPSKYIPRWNYILRNHDQLSFFLSIFTGSLIHEHYTRECEFGNFDKIKKTKTQKLLAWLNFCLNKECPKLLCGLGICHRRRQTIPMWNSSGGKKEFFRASLYVWCLRY